jgi:hypothetical protein
LESRRNGCDVHLIPLARPLPPGWRRRVVHPLSCVVEAAAARQLCQVLEVRRALLHDGEALLDTLLCALCDYAMAAAP